MIRRISLLLCLLALFTEGALAQATLNAARVTGSSTTARFTLGLSLNNGSSYVTTATTDDSVRIIGAIQPEAAQVGQQADIYVVAMLGNSYYMRNAAGNFVPWNFSIPELVPFRSKQTLTSSFAVDFITGKIPVTGTLQLFLGYKAADNVLTYTPVPHAITITAPVAGPTILQQATDLFASTISPRIIQSTCIACHVKGGQADGLSGLLYVFASNSNHLSLNFTALKNFTKSNGRAFILSKASGDLGHVGGAMLPFGSTDYKNMDSFLQLVEKL